MTRKIDILGFQLDNETVREAMRQVEFYLENQELNTIEKVSAGMLIESERDPVLKEVIQSLDLAVIGEKEILQVAGIDTMQRIRETEENDFFFEFFRQMEREERTLFLLGETEEQVAQSREQLTELFPKLCFDGAYALERCVGNQDAVVNEINAATPDVVLSVLPSPLQEHFLMEHRDKIGANLWYGVGSVDAIRGNRGTRQFFRSLLHRSKLKSSLKNHEEQSGE
jgi:N-acetylglucosaminyldiphosphoundecaprenol N-acetyl-beta-D-mannosaminyltransferase